MMHQGKLWAIGPTADVLTPENLQVVFNVDAVILETPVGVQICPLSPKIPLNPP